MKKFIVSPSRRILATQKVLTDAQFYDAFESAITDILDVDSQYLVKLVDTVGIYPSDLYAELGESKLGYPCADIYLTSSRGLNSGGREWVCSICGYESNGTQCDVNSSSWRAKVGRYIVSEVESLIL